MGVGKRELLEDYYADELAPLMAEWAALRGGDDTPVEVDAQTFFGDGGEWLE